MDQIRSESGKGNRVGERVMSDKGRGSKSTSKEVLGHQNKSWQSSMRVLEPQIEALGTNISN